MTFFCPRELPSEDTKADEETKDTKKIKEVDPYAIKKGAAEPQSPFEKSAEVKAAKGKHKKGSAGARNSVMAELANNLKRSSSNTS